MPFKSIVNREAFFTVGLITNVLLPAMFSTMISSTWFRLLTLTENDPLLGFGRILNTFSCEVSLTPTKGIFIKTVELSSQSMYEAVRLT